MGAPAIGQWLRAARSRWPAWRRPRRGLAAAGGRLAACQTPGAAASAVSGLQGSEARLPARGAAPPPRSAAAGPSRGGAGGGWSAVCVNSLVPGEAGPCGESAAGGGGNSAARPGWTVRGAAGAGVSIDASPAGVALASPAGPAFGAAASRACQFSAAAFGGVARRTARLFVSSAANAVAGAKAGAEAGKIAGVFAGGGFTRRFASGFTGGSADGFADGSAAAGSAADGSAVVDPQFNFVHPSRRRDTDRFSPRFPQPGSAAAAPPSPRWTSLDDDEEAAAEGYLAAPQLRPRQSSSYSASSVGGARASSLGDRATAPGGAGFAPAPPFGSDLAPRAWTPEAVARLPPFDKNFYRERPEVAARSNEEIRELLARDRVTVRGDLPIPKPVRAFAELELPAAVATALRDFDEPTAIQKIGLPIALAGRDFVGISDTGSGKTLAFLVPAMVHIEAQLRRWGGGAAAGGGAASGASASDDPFGAATASGGAFGASYSVRPRERSPIALILAPTRELAEQIYTEALRLAGSGFAASSGVRVSCVYGGSSKRQQAYQLQRGVDLLIACPGRLIDFLQVRQISHLERTTYLVLDEADRMLDMGFEPQIRAIVSQIRPDRQTLFYSATWPPAVEELAFDFCAQRPVKVQIGSTELHANKDVVQKIIVTPAYAKQERFLDLAVELARGAGAVGGGGGAAAGNGGGGFGSGGFGGAPAASGSAASASGGGSAKILVFCATRRNADSTAFLMRRRGLRAAAIHGQKVQEERDRIMADFRAGRTPILVATDVASRGIDVKDVTHVINLDAPSTIEDYVHRIGRTGRAGRGGVSITFLEEDLRTSAAVQLARDIAKLIKMAGQTPPNELLKTGLMVR